MSTCYNNDHHENHQRAAELHDQAAHVHRNAAETHEKQDRQTGHEHSRQALEHSHKAYQHSEQLYTGVLNGHGISSFGHTDIAALASYAVGNERLSGRLTRRRLVPSGATIAGSCGTSSDVSSSIERIGIRETGSNVIAQQPPQLPPPNQPLARSIRGPHRSDCSLRCSYRVFMARIPRRSGFATA